MLTNEHLEKLKTLKNGERQTRASFEYLVSLCKFRDWRFVLKSIDEEHMYMQIVFTDSDAFHGAEEEQKCRKWLLSFWMKDTEVVDSVFAAVERAMRHEVHEQFSFAGRRIHNPHRNVWSLYEIATGGENIDIRKPAVVGV